MGILYEFRVQQNIDPARLIYYLTELKDKQNKGQAILMYSK